MPTQILFEKDSDYLFASEICNLTTESGINPKINYNNVNVGIEDYTRL